MKPLVVIAGPTASGKSALALALAEARGGVVINADSAQVYGDLRILTARPSAADEARVPHLLYGHIDGAEEYSAARWASEATAAIDAAHAAGRLPIVVGGTGLYLRTLLDGIAPVPAIDPHVRADVRAMPVAAAYAELEALDPAAAGRLHANDTTRVARALEVVRATGRPLAEWQAARAGGIAARVTLTARIVLPDRATLIERCDARVAEMIETGAVEEVRALLDRPGIAAAAPVRRAIGVAEIAALIGGTATVDTTIEAVRLATRQYAKRQYTWFRNQPPPEWQRISFVTLDSFVL